MIDLMKKGLAITVGPFCCSKGGAFCRRNSRGRVSQWYISGIFVIGAEGDRRGSGGNLSTRDNPYKDNLGKPYEYISGIFVIFVCLCLLSVIAFPVIASPLGGGDKSLIYNTLINTIGALPYPAMRLNCILL